MTESERYTRRTVLIGTGVAGTTALAGCAGPGDEDEENDNGAENGLEDADWEDVDEFYFEGVVEHWGGIEPEFLEGTENPTLTLIEGQEYDFRWVNGDGITHNLEIRNEDGDIVDDYQSEDVEEEGEETTLEGVVATEEMTTYICTYHEATQVGDITVESE
ncbi:hypothetical protein [Natronolimnohabitans innermongolicus]|uniref:PKD domain-containing protein n=1 Tax=Natronolimnohabitans innermongolicus JCM 12255 TaxID=1227499 RepID=L9XAP1_9EURY|nr:hypothetical protein [Natronolimnohabitans innermongolicus]ELY58702.1 PKD domain-containing protein [Natronolimnohabitans innermongolicus JCM 12255]